MRDEDARRFYDVFLTYGLLKHGESPVEINSDQIHELAGITIAWTNLYPTFTR